jgi:hypothetical protein
MELPVIFIIVAIVIAIIFISYFFSKKARIKRKLKKAAFKKMAEFKDGETAKIVGEVEIIGEPLIAPLSGRKCSYYYIHIEERVKSGKSWHWRTRVEEEVSGKFVIKEGEKYAFINDNNLNCYIVQDRNFSSGFLNDASKNLEKYLNTKGYESEGILGLNRTLRYKEGVLENGEEIAVFGTGKWKDVSALNLPEKYGKVLEITSNNGEAIYLSDDPDTTEKTIKKNIQSTKGNNIESRYKK